MKRDYVSVIVYPILAIAAFAIMTLAACADAPQGLQGLSGVDGAPGRDGHDGVDASADLEARVAHLEAVIAEIECETHGKGRCK